MRTTRTLLLVLAVFSVIFILTELFFVPKTYVNSAIVQALQSPGIFIRSLRDQHQLFTQLTAAQLENQSLRGQLAVAENRPGISKEGKVEYLRAPVYSTYPLNNAGSILIGAGLSEGVQLGMVVEAEPEVFLGEVTNVYKHQSEVRTLHDPEWELAVKIGPDKVDSLLIGGHEPRLTLISKKKPAAPEMSVFLAVKKYPYGLLVGTMGDPADSEKNLFQEAALTLPFLFSDINQVYVRLSQ